MKAIKIIIAAVLSVFSCTSCLHKDLKELDVYKGADITAAYVYYRYIENDAVKQVTLAYENDIKTDACTVNIAASLPTDFPESQRSKISAKELVVAVQISTAAVIYPGEGSPALGTPADWTTPHKYIVQAANGDKKEWTISLTLTK